jgi:hypothetical protein
MRGGYSLQLLREAHPERDQNFQREFEQVATALGPRYYPRENA